jgi:predicted transcriptional regulator
MIKLSELKKEWLQNPDIEQQYKELEPEFEMAREFIRARITSNMTQSDVAKKMKTTQSAIARLESGKAVPTMKTVERFAKAVGMNFKFHFVAAQG